MYDFSYSKSTLNREFTASDFEKMPSLTDAVERQNIISRAEGYAENGFSTLLLDKHNVRGRDLYQYGSLSKELVLRKLSRNIRILTKVRQSNRDDIVRSLVALLREGEDFDVYRLDIKNFYPSISREHLNDMLKSDSRLPASSFVVWQSFSRSLTARSISGLPPGVSISATLSEYLMKSFDRHANSLPGVYFYARYVDDIIMLTLPQGDRVQFINSMAANLPTGLSLNIEKTMSVALRGSPKPPVKDGTVEFLGYKFEVFTKARQGDRYVRQVNVDIADKKVSRLKSRLMLSILEFTKGGSFQDLEDRIRLLTGNYHIYDRDYGFRRNVGIFYNYNKISLDTQNGLHSLDHFLKSVILSRSGRICSRLNNLITSGQRRRLLKYSFCTSFEQKTHYHYNSARLADLTECWKYE